MTTYLKKYPPGDYRAVVKPLTGEPARYLTPELAARAYRRAVRWAENHRNPAPGPEFTAKMPRWMAYNGRMGL